MSFSVEATKVYIHLYSEDNVKVESSEDSTGKILRLEFSAGKSAQFFFTAASFEKFKEAVNAN